MFIETERIKATSIDGYGVPVLNPDGSFVGNPPINEIDQLMSAEDKVETYTWLDFATANERISTIVYSSASLALSATDTFAYTLTSGVYRLDTITRVLV
jgi:hypothetical protein